jgi:uncharacterized protein (TIGR02596 family)
MRVRSAFSLIELLVVIAIIGLLMTAAAPTLNSVLENGRLTQAAKLLVNPFTLARQRASAENKNITLRFIRKDASSPYDHIQLVTLDSANNATPVSRLTPLPIQTAIANDPALTSLMSLTETPSSANDPSLPELGTSYLYKQCTFRPRGSLDLNIQSKWFATVVLQRNASDTAAQPTSPPSKSTPSTAACRFLDHKKVLPVTIIAEDFNLFMSNSDRLRSFGTLSSCP